MSTVYRWTVWTDSVAEKKRSASSAHGSLSFKRDSKAALKQALDAFYQTIRSHMPDGRDARAWLEKSDKYGPSTLVSLKLRVERITTTPHRWIHAWEDQHGAIVASFIYEIDPASGLRTMNTGRRL